MRLDGVKFLRIFNLVVFTILFGSGLYFLYFRSEGMDIYLTFGNQVVKVLIPLIGAAFGGAPLKKALENRKLKIEKAQE